jgi:UDP-glucose 4-epimerase
MKQRFLVTGGAGYVGSHLVAELLDRGAACVVLDNFCTGHHEAVLPGARLIEGGLADADLLDAVLADGPWDAVFHFAARSLVGESMRDPMLYFIENAGNGARLIDACVRHGVRRFDRVHGLRSACLRYFNAAGADPGGRLGEDHRPETHLIPLVIDAALGRRDTLEVFGDDFATPDGTAVRDYVHVADLTDAHLRVLGQLEQGSVAYNLGTGRGHSVLEVVRAVERAGGRRVPLRHVGRRPGDPPMLVASSARITAETGWRPRFTVLDDIVATALQWREAHPAGYGIL